VREPRRSRVNGRKRRPRRTVVSRALGRSPTADWAPRAGARARRRTRRDAASATSRRVRRKRRSRQGSRSKCVGAGNWIERTPYASPAPAGQPPLRGLTPFTESLQRSEVQAAPGRRRESSDMSIGRSRRAAARGNMCGVNGPAFRRAGSPTAGTAAMSDLQHDLFPAPALRSTPSPNRPRRPPFARPAAEFETDCWDVHEAPHARGLRFICSTYAGPPASPKATGPAP